MSENDNNEKENDPILNIKSEFNRKLSNQERQIEQLMQLNQQIVEQVTTLSSTLRQPQSSGGGKFYSDDDQELSDLAATDPGKYAKIVTERAVKAATESASKVNQTNQRRQEVLANLVSDYPELTSDSSDLKTRAIQIYGSMSKSEQESPTAYKVAVRDAAAELGLLPASKRPKRDSGDESFTGSSSGGSGRRASSGSSKGKISEATLQFAQLVGFDINNADVVKSLEKRAQRKNWHRYGRGGEE